MSAVMIGIFLLTAFVSSRAGAAELRQQVSIHQGACDDTEHWGVPVWTNTHPGPVQVVATRLVMFGDGTQWAYLARRSDGLWFTWGHHQQPITGNISQARETPAATVTIAPGDGVVLNHACWRPSGYGIYSIVEYIE